jgi:carbonic anhydrase
VDRRIGVFEGEVMKLSICVVAISLALWTSQCAQINQGSESAPPAERVAETEQAKHDGEIHWGYQGEVGPEHWADLSPEFSLCGEGVEQSPINLTAAKVVKGSALERQLGKAILTLEQRARVMDLVDNGHTIQVTNDAPMALDLEGKHYELVQYHFHAPSEHMIDGQHVPLEVHFVLKSATGNLAVLSVLVEEGEHSPVWDVIIEALPSGPGEARHLEGLDLDFNEFRPVAERYYRYRGSLTTPPCSEGVEWVVKSDKDQISPEQMAALTSHLRKNNRPVQPLGTRELLLVSSE